MVMKIPSHKNKLIIKEDEAWWLKNIQPLWGGLWILLYSKFFKQRGMSFTRWGGLECYNY